jgi:hypothetical protein
MAVAAASGGQHSRRQDRNDRSNWLLHRIHLFSEGILPINRAVRISLQPSCGTPM